MITSGWKKRWSSEVYTVVMVLGVPDEVIAPYPLGKAMGVVIDLLLFVDVMAVEGAATDR